MATPTVNSRKAFEEWVASTDWPSLNQHAYEPFVAGYKAGWADAAQYVQQVQMMIHIPAEGGIQ